MQNVSPYGPQRDDIRAAFNTASIRVSHATGEVTTEQVREVIESLIEYLPCERTDDGLELDAEALRRMKEGG
jgi:predicted DNA-binding protein